MTQEEEVQVHKLRMRWELDREDRVLDLRWLMGIRILWGDLGVLDRGLGWGWEVVEGEEGGCHLVRRLRMEGDSRLGRKRLMEEDSRLVLRRRMGFETFEGMG